MTKSGLKINSSKSMFGKKEDENPNFDEDAKNLNERRMESNHKGFDLGKRFFKIVNDRTLNDNKGPISASVENEVITELVHFAIEMNSDESQPEGMGGVAVSTILLKSILALRDRCNDLEYKTVEQSRKIAELSGQIKTNEK